MPQNTNKAMGPVLLVVVTVSVGLMALQDSPAVVAATGVTAAVAILLGLALLRWRTLIMTNWAVQLSVVLAVTLGVWSAAGLTILGDSPSVVVAVDLTAVGAILAGVAIGWWRDRRARS